MEVHPGLAVRVVVLMPGRAEPTCSLSYGWSLMTFVFRLASMA